MSEFYPEAVLKQLTGKPPVIAEWLIAVGTRARKQAPSADLADLQMEIAISAETRELETADVLVGHLIGVLGQQDWDKCFNDLDSWQTILAISEGVRKKVRQVHQSDT